MNRLANILREAGKPACRLESPDGAGLLILPYGGRVIGLFTPKSGKNLLWTNPALASVESARAFYESSGWHNSGGNRTWLAPEIDLFLPDYPVTDRYFQPRQLDPGDYRLVDNENGLTLTNKLSVDLKRSGKTLDLAITKSISPTANPFESDSQPYGLEYAGYKQTTSLRILGDTAAPIGLWDLLQMPHGGELFIATWSQTEPRVYFGNIPADDLTTTDQMVCYKMRQAGEHKIGVKSAAVTGRMVYVYEDAEESVLIARDFDVDPSGEYIDVPWDDEEDFGYAVQACNVNSSLGAFSEMEYHAPAIGFSGRTECRDISYVWAFRGCSEAVMDISAVILQKERI